MKIKRKQNLAFFLHQTGYNFFNEPKLTNWEVMHLVDYHNEIERKKEIEIIKQRHKNK